MLATLDADTSEWVLAASDSEGGGEAADAGLSEEERELLALATTSTTTGGGGGDGGGGGGGSTDLWIVGGWVVVYIVWMCVSSFFFMCWASRDVASVRKPEGPFCGAGWGRGLGGARGGGAEGLSPLWKRRCEASLSLGVGQYASLFFASPSSPFFHKKGGRASPRFCPRGGPSRHRCVAIKEPIERTHTRAMRVAAVLFRGGASVSRWSDASGPAAPATDIFVCLSYDDMYLYIYPVWCV